MTQIDLYPNEKRHNQLIIVLAIAAAILATLLVISVVEQDNTERQLECSRATKAIAIADRNTAQKLAIEYAKQAGTHLALAELQKARLSSLKRNRSLIHPRYVEESNRIALLPFGERAQLFTTRTRQIAEKDSCKW